MFVPVLEKNSPNEAVKAAIDMLTGQAKHQSIEIEFYPLRNDEKIMIDTTRVQ